MSYSSSYSSSPRSSTRRLGSAPPSEVGPESARAVGKSASEEVDWGKIGVFGAGVAIGAALGAAVALAFAPSSGEELREQLGDRMRGFGSSVAGAWDDRRVRSGRQMAQMRKRLRRRLQRAATRARWSAEDALR
jgi:gas vesicle protein